MRTERKILETFSIVRFQYLNFLLTFKSSLCSIVNQWKIDDLCHLLVKQQLYTVWLYTLCYINLNMKTFVSNLMLQNKNAIVSRIFLT